MNKKGSALHPAVITAIFYLVIELLGVTCPIRFLTGISCAGCGMSRALLALGHLDVGKAWHFHPLFILPFVALILFLNKQRIPKKVYNGCFMIMAVLMIAVYLIRIFDPLDDIVVFEPQNGFISYIIKKIWGIIK